MKLREHPILREQWPPQPQSTSVGSNKSPVGNLDVLEWLYYYPAGRGWPANIALKTNYNGRNYVRDIFLEDALFAEKLASHLRKHVGHSIGQVGDMEIDF